MNRFGWAADNLWPVVTSLIFTPIVNEFAPDRPPLLQLAQNIGLLVGAMFWGKRLTTSISRHKSLTRVGFGCDIFGRRWAFNITLGIVAVWGMIAGSANDFAAIGSFAALWSFGVGG